MAIARKKNEKKTCSSCNRNLTSPNNFYTINGNEPAFKDGIYPVCKDCCKKLVNDELDGHKNFLKILMVLNRKYEQDLFKQSGFDRAAYLNKINGNAKRITDGFLSSEDLFNGNVASVDVDTINKLTPEELRECQLFWGVGDYTEDDYLFLMADYEKYLNVYDVDTPTFESIIAQICQLDLEIRNKRNKGQNPKDETKLQLELMRNAGIAPSQEKASKTNEAQSFGNWVKIWENEKPVPEPLEEFKDVDGIEKYIRNSFLSPMLTSLEVNNPHEEEYHEHKEKYGISKEELLGISGEE